MPTAQHEDPQRPASVADAIAQLLELGPVYEQQVEEAIGLKRRGRMTAAVRRAIEVAEKTADEGRRLCDEAIDLARREPAIDRHRIIGDLSRLRSWWLEIRDDQTSDEHYHDHLVQPRPLVDYLADLAKDLGDLQAAAHYGTATGSATEGDEDSPTLDQEDVVFMDCLRNEAGAISIRRLAIRHNLRLRQVRASDRRHLGRIARKLITLHFVQCAGRQLQPDERLDGRIGLTARGRHILEKLLQ